MSNQQKSNRLSLEEDDDDETAFHSADEGDGDESDDSKKIDDRTRIDENKLIDQSPKDEISIEPAQEIPTRIVSKSSSPADHLFSLPLKEKSPHQKIEELPSPSHQDDQPRVENPVGDGWDLDDWGNEEKDESDVDEIMTTPSTEKPLSSEFSQRIERPMMKNRIDAGTTSRDEETMQKPTSLWGGWGQLLSLATDSISTLTNTVGEGFTSVLETVETTLGAPTPEEMARMSSQEREALKIKADQVKEPAPVGEKDDCDSASEEVSSEGGSDAGATRSDKEDLLSSGYQSEGGPGGQRNQEEIQREHGFASLFSGVSNLFENTGRTIVSGSLDVLETLGRKTFETVTVNEPSGDNQRRRLKIPIPSGGRNRSEKTTLSQILRELKEKAEVEAKQKKQEQEARRCNYAALFEDAQGLVHLEALELLSTTCCQQTRSLMELLTSDQMEEVATSMENLKLLFDSADGKNVIDEEPTEPNLAVSIKRDLKFTSFTPSRLLLSDTEARKWITKVIEEQDKGERIDAKEIYEKCMATLATFTAAGVEMYHKVGQLLLIPNSGLSSSNNAGEDLPVGSLINITHTLSDELSYLSSRYTTALNTASDDSEDPDSVNRMLTNVFYEASNSVGYVQEALKLMLPIVQLASVRQRLR